MIVTAFGRVAKQWFFACAVAATFASSAAGCVKQLPPAPPPNAVAPPIDTSTPPREGYGRLIVDVVDGPTPVQRVMMESQPFEDAEGRTRYRFVEVPHSLCDASPCIVDLAVGNVLLGFPVTGKSTTEVELVHIGEETTVYRRSLGVYHRTPKGAKFVLGIIAASVGTAAAITGATLVPIGLGDDDKQLAFAGGITLAGGAVLTALGVWAIRSEANTFRPGSSVHFPLGSP